MQLIEIRTTPMKYELQIENARLEPQNEYVPPQPVASFKPARLDCYTRNIQVRLNSYEMRKEFNMKNNLDLAKDAAQKGYHNIRELTDEYVQTGRQLAQIQDGVSIGQIIQQKMMEQPSMYTVFLPNAAPEVSWVPNELQTQYTPSELNYDFKEMRNVLNYIPGSVRLNILQYADVTVKYLGGPNYVPPSADPNYEQKSS